MFQSYQCSHLGRTAWVVCLQKLLHNCLQLVFCWQKLEEFLNIYRNTLILVYFHLDFGIIPCKSAHLSWRKTFSILGYLNGGIFQIWVLWSFNCYFFRLRLFLKQKLFCWLHLSKSFQIVERWCWIVQFKIQLKYFNKNLSISRLNNFKLSNLLNNLSLILFCLFLNSKLGQLLISSLKNFCNFAKKLSPWFKGIVLIFLCNLSSISKVRRI